MNTSFSPYSRFILAVLCATVITCGSSQAANPRQILICSDSQVSPYLRKVIDDFTAHAGQVPLLKALIDGKEATGIAAQVSESLMAPKVYQQAAHNHLVVIGLRSQDPLMDKVWGYDATIDETQKISYSEGCGYLQGDIGWIESDWNPFLHSQKIDAAPEDTITVKITGTSEAGVVAALRAFQGGMYNGFVAAGPLSRPQTTLLDQNPLPDPAPGMLPMQVKIGNEMANLAGWTQIPEQEYRAVLESGGVEPKKMWRYKYLPPGMLEQPSIIRWLGGVNHMAYGNAIDIVQCASAEEASNAAKKIAAITFPNRQPALMFNAVTVSGTRTAWVSPQASDETTPSTWKIIVTSSGPYLFLSSLPPEGTAAVIATVVGPGAH